jgi:signal transduction histidine kinase
MRPGAPDGILADALDALPCPVCLYDGAQRLVFANRRAATAIAGPEGAVPLGAPLAEILRRLAERGHLGAGDPETEIAQHLALDRTRPTRHLLREADGRLVDIRTIPLRHGGFCGIILDVTEYATASDAARSRARMLEMALAHLDGGIALYDQDRRLLLHNARYEALNGLGPGTLVPGISRGVVAQRVAEEGEIADPEAEAALAAAIARDPAIPFSFQRARPNGTVVQVESRPVAGLGQLIEMSDITELKRVENEARQRAAMLQGTLDGIRHGIALYGPDRRLVLANRLAAEGHGLPPLEQRIGMPFEVLVREQLRLGIFGAGAEAACIAADVIALDRTVSHHYQRRLPDGRVMEVRSDPTPGGGFVISHSDVTELVAAQAEASRRAALLEVMQDSMRHGIALYDADRRLIAANRLAARFTGLGDVAAMIGQTIDALRERQVALGELSPDAAARQAAIDFSRPNRVLRQRPDGTMLEVTADPAPDGGFIMTYTDVTALTALEAESRHRADVLQVMLDNMRHGIVHFGPDRRVIAANALAEALGGHAPGSVRAGRGLDALIAEQVAGGELPRSVAAMALQLDRRLPHRYARARPEGGVVEVTSDPTPDGGFVVTMTDVSALAEAEGRAKRQAAIQQVMLDNIRHGILLVDAAGRVVAANRVFCQLLGLPEAVVAAGQPFTAFVDLLEAAGEYGRGPEAAAIARNIRERDRSQPIRSTRTRPNGTVIEAVSDPMPDGGWVLTFTDITPARRAQEEIERARDAAESANRAKSRFLATMSHELRTPLNAVIGFSEALLAMPAGKTEPDFLRAIHDAGRHLLALIDDILDVTRSETTGLQVTETALDTAELAEDMARVMGAAATSAGVALRTVLEPGLPRIRADALRLRQVLLNLMENAVKFTPEGGSVTLSAGLEPGGGLAIRVSDTGIGMPAEAIPRAFEPFTQLDDAPSRRFQGSGIGLYLSRALAAAQGAELTLDSSPGAGTTATLRFPPDRLLR